MVRQLLPSRLSQRVVRAPELFRIEALSDAVFAFSVSLLIMSLEVPQTFAALHVAIRNLPPFLATFAFVFMLWYQQHLYFRHYGLENRYVVLLNLALLAWLLVYIFPLKFLFSLLLSWFLGVNYFPEAVAHGKRVLEEGDFPRLVVFFSIGYCIIWLLFFLLYRHVYKKRYQLHIISAELFYVKSEMRDAVFQMTAGLVSMVFALAGFPGLSGFVFITILPWLFLNSWLLRQSLRKHSTVDLKSVK